MNFLRNVDYKWVIIIILALLLAFFWWRSGSNYNKYQEQIALTEAANDSLKTYVDKDGIQRARIAVLETNQAKTFLAFQSQDTLIKQLQKEVARFKENLKNSGSVTIIKETLRVDTVFKGGVQILPGDTVKQDSFIFVYPKYARDYNLDDWIKGKVEMDKNSLKLDFKSKNTYSVVIGEEKQGLFKKPKAFVDVSNENPWSETKAVRTYKVTKKQKKIELGLGAYTGYGATRIRDGTVQTGVQLGIGLVLKINLF